MDTNKIAAINQILRLQTFDEFNNVLSILNQDSAWKKTRLYCPVRIIHEVIFRILFSDSNISLIMRMPVVWNKRLKPSEPTPKTTSQN
jgi:hypothetical protein